MKENFTKEDLKEAYEAGVHIGFHDGTEEELRGNPPDYDNFEEWYEKWRCELCDLANKAGIIDYKCCKCGKN